MNRSSGLKRGPFSARPALVAGGALLFAVAGANAQVAVPVGAGTLGASSTTSCHIEAPAATTAGGSFLSAHYRFDETTGVVAADASFNRFHGLYANPGREWPALTKAPLQAISRDGTNGVRSWPETAGAFHLESTTAFNLAGAWSPWPGPFETNAGGMLAPVASTDAQRFFRLQAP